MLFRSAGFCAGAGRQPQSAEEPGTLKKGCVSYHLRDGKHDLTKYDWNVYMDFADAHGWRAAH